MREREQIESGLFFLKYKRGYLQIVLAHYLANVVHKSMSMEAIKRRESRSSCPVIMRPVDNENRDFDF